MSLDGHGNEDLPGGYGEDYDWLLRASRVGKVGVVNEILADIRKRLGLTGGGAVYLDETADGVVLRTVPQSRKHSGGAEDEKNRANNGGA